MQLSNPFKPARSITGGYGPRDSFRLPDGRWTLPFHYGSDFSAPAGTKIYAAYPGKVIHSGWDNSGYGGGWQIAIQYGQYTVFYLHMRAQSHLKKGANVKRGQHIGYVGSTGASTGPHLHLEVHKGSGTLNPAPLFTYKAPKPKPASKKDEDMPTYFSAWRSKNTAGQTKAVTYATWGKGTQTLTPGRQNHLYVSAKKSMTVAGTGVYELFGSVHLKGNPGDGFTLGAVRGTWDAKNGWKETAFLESIRGEILENGEAKIQLGIANEVASGQRIRFYVHPDKASKPITVNRYSVKGWRW